MFLAQRRNGATKTRRNAVALCVVAPLRKKSSLFVQSPPQEAQKAQSELDGKFWLLFLAGPYYDALAWQ